MSTAADFVGKNCPHCGAVDSLQTDDALGEVACTECALVVAMGLEENTLTRFNKDATYDDVDMHRAQELNDFVIGGGKASPFTEIRSSSSLSLSTATKNALSKVKLNSSMLDCIRSLQKKTGVPETVGQNAVNIAKLFVYGRRARGQRVEKYQNVAAACFMIAAEKANHPIPLAEVRNLDSTLGDVTFRRAEIVKDLGMEEEENRLKAVYADNLLSTYLCKLGLQHSLYAPHCKRLLGALQRVGGLVSVALAEKVMIAVLLSLTAQSFLCETRPTSTAATGGRQGNGAENIIERVYANFAAKAHLDLDKINKLMQTAISNQQAILAEFNTVTSSANNTTKEEDGDDDGSNGNLPLPAKRVKFEEN